MKPDGGGQTPVLNDARGRPLRDLRISLTDSCNFRCTYCLPKELFGDQHPFLPPEALLDTDEILRLVRIFTALGVEKVKLTGGEPLLSPRLPELIRGLGSLPGLRDLGLITNGFYLRRLAGKLWDAGLRRINVSLDSLGEARFGQINGRGIGPKPVLEGIEAAYALGMRPVKVNMVVQRGVNEGELEAMAERFRRPGLALRFIEFMDTGRTAWTGDQVVPSAEILGRLQARWPLKALSPAFRGEVAERWGYADGQGEVGFISSVSDPFCGDCSRVRLGPDGRLHTCLFSDESRGLDLRALLRGGAKDEEISARIAALWRGRDDRYSELRAAGVPNPGVPNPGRKLNMFHIGG